MFTKELTGACSAPVILGIIARGDSYGYQILQDLKNLSGGKLNWADGMIYPVLRKLEKQTLLDSYWHQPESGRKRRYYKLTKKGYSSLSAEQSQWRSANDILEKIWNNQLDPKTV